MKALLASAAFAAIAFAAPASAQAVWTQMPVTDPGSAVSSQDFEAGNNQYDSIVIDDFTLTSKTNLTSLDALIQSYNSSSNNVGNISNFTVNIYSSVAKAASGLAGDVFSATVPNSGVTISDPFGSWSQMVHVPFAATLAAGTYYVGLINQLDYGSYGQMGVETWGSGNGYLINPGAGFGSTSMTLSSIYAGGNAAYRLNGAAATAAVPELGTWVMMVVGVGVLGSMMRTRRRKALATA